MVLDANLPTYYIRASTEPNKRFDCTVRYSHNGSDPEARYTLRHADPTTRESKNVYACGLQDIRLHQVLYGEVLMRPDWQPPNPSSVDNRAHSGVNQAPIALIPPKFSLWLYNPDQEVVVTEKKGTFGNLSYHFDLPQYVFRLPSASALDQEKINPSLDPSTPMLQFVWKKEGVSSKDLICRYTGKSTLDSTNKKKGGSESPTHIAKLENYRDLFIYEGNMSRLEIEDPAGLEYILLISAVTLRDVYYGQRKNAFNVDSLAHQQQRKNTTPSHNHPATTAIASAEANLKEQERSDAEKAAQLQKQMDKEEIERRKKEEKERRKREAEIAAETERLKKQYGNQLDLLSNIPSRPAHTQLQSQSQSQPQPRPSAWNNPYPSHVPPFQSVPQVHQMPYPTYTTPQPQPYINHQPPPQAWGKVPPLMPPLPLRPSNSVPPSSNNTNSGPNSLTSFLASATSALQGEFNKYKKTSTVGRPRRLSDVGPAEGRLGRQKSSMW